MAQDRKAAAGKRNIDRIDRRILQLLQSDARIPNTDLAKKVNLSSSPCLRRVSLLADAGYVRMFKAVLDPIRLGFTVRAFLSIKRSRESDQREVSSKIASVPEVIACHVVSGEYDLLAEVVARDMQHYAEITLETISKIDGVYDLRSSFSIRAIKTDGDLPIGDLEA